MQIWKIAILLPEKKAFTTYSCSFIIYHYFSSSLKKKKKKQLSYSWEDSSVQILTLTWIMEFYKICDGV